MWRGLYKRGSLASDGAFQLVPFSMLFVEQWCVLWSALQAFILVAKDSLPDCATAISNSLFLGLGVVNLITHVTFVVIGTINGNRLWE